MLGGVSRHAIGFQSRKIDPEKEFVHCGFKYTWLGIPVDDPTSSVRRVPRPTVDDAHMDDDSTDEEPGAVHPVRSNMHRVPPMLCSPPVPAGIGLRQ